MKSRGKNTIKYCASRKPVISPQRPPVQAAQGQEEEHRHEKRRGSRPWGSGWGWERGENQSWHPPRAHPGQDTEPPRREKSKPRLLRLKVEHNWFLSRRNWKCRLYNLLATDPQENLEVPEGVPNCLSLWRRSSSSTPCTSMDRWKDRKNTL